MSIYIFFPSPIFFLRLNFLAGTFFLINVNILIKAIFYVCVCVFMMVVLKSISDNSDIVLSQC